MIVIDYKDRRPIYEQIVAKFEKLILIGALTPNSPMPSVRALAMELSINPNTIQRAYAELERRKLIYTVKGKGSFVLGNETLIVERKNQIFKKITELVHEATEAGITKDEMIREIEVNYEGGERHD